MRYNFPTLPEPERFDNEDVIQYLKQLEKYKRYVARIEAKWNGMRKLYNPGKDTNVPKKRFSGHLRKCLYPVFEMPESRVFDYLRENAGMIDADIKLVRRSMSRTKIKGERCFAVVNGNYRLTPMERERIAATPKQFGISPEIAKKYARLRA